MDRSGGGTCTLAILVIHSQYVQSAQRGERCAYVCAARYMDPGNSKLGGRECSSQYVISNQKMSVLNAQKECHAHKFSQRNQLGMCERDREEGQKTLTNDIVHPKKE